MPLLDKLFISGVWVAAAARLINTTGTPVVSVTNLNNGQDIPDDYTLTLSSVSAGTATITVGTLSPNNPYKGRVITAVPLDGVTVVTNIIPGLSMIFSAGGANANVAAIYIGDYFGTFDASGVGAGVPSAGVRHQVANSGVSLISGAIATLLTQAVLVKKTGTVFGEIRPFAPAATEKVAGGGSLRVMPYALKVINVIGAGALKVADLQVDGVTLGANTIVDLMTGTSVSGVGLKAISPGNGYRIVSGPLNGLEFSLSASCATNDIANVLIFPSRFVQIAEDVAGVAGTYGTANINLTQVGQAVGSITAGNEAYYWVRILVPDGAGSESNPYPCNVALQGNESGAANWLG